jgi:hypothetical protein
MNISATNTNFQGITNTFTNAITCNTLNSSATNSIIGIYTTNTDGQADILTGTRTASTNILTGTGSNTLNVGAINMNCNISSSIMNISAATMNISATNTNFQGINNTFTNAITCNTLSSTTTNSAIGIYTANTGGQVDILNGTRTGTTNILTGTGSNTLNVGGINMSYNLSAAIMNLSANTMNLSATNTNFQATNNIFTNAITCNTLTSSDINSGIGIYTDNTGGQANILTGTRTASTNILTGTGTNTLNVGAINMNCNISSSIMNLSASKMNLSASNMSFTGRTDINTTGSNATNIGTGTNNGIITIGNAATSAINIGEPITPNYTYTANTGTNIVGTIGYIYFLNGSAVSPAVNNQTYNQGSLTIPVGVYIIVQRIGITNTTGSNATCTRLRAQLGTGGTGTNNISEISIVDTLMGNGSQSGNNMGYSTAVIYVATTTVTITSSAIVNFSPVGAVDLNFVQLRIVRIA